MNVMRKQIKNLFSNYQATMGHGLWFSGYENEGEFKEWWENGNLCVQLFCKGGKQNGECKKWDDNGQLWLHCFYKDGIKDGEYKRWENGKPAEQCFYKDGKRDGEYKSWYKNCQPKEQAFIRMKRNVVNIKSGIKMVN